ncbi:hypothetical protein SUGI_0886930 [Cryptomeria japonica]|uniref:SCARECROW-LIKE protein 7 n=1 Tax=Cryptomeria japonica TaxID=3369 RepID=UPI002414AAEE|nr:SCARECROW-LIKE protein 7 [Cryptomeria japonica]GLJ42771.1 hypothetical protein SUGI_0886930 [Cryptomeria japonica]
METESHNIAQQHYSYYQYSQIEAILAAEEEIRLAGIRTCDVDAIYLSTISELSDSLQVSSSSPAGGCFKSPEPAESKNEDWMEWLAKDICDHETSSNDSDSTESSDTTGSALYCSSPSQDLAEPRPDLASILFRYAKLAESQNQGKAAKALAELQVMLPPVRVCSSSTQRLVSYFARGLCGDVDIMEPGEQALAYQALNDACPYLNFAHLTANQAILETAEKAEKIHIIDFGIREGVQWAALLQAFSSRPQGKPRRIKISALPNSAESASSLSSTGTRLTAFASMLGLELQFNPVFKPLSEINEEESFIFNFEEEECLALNFMLCLSELPETALLKALKFARSLRPKIVTLAEYDLRGGLENAFHYFSAMFESLEGKFSAEREMAEKLLFTQTITKFVAENNNCVEASEEWRSKFELAGFQCCNASQYAISQAKILLWNYSDKFSLVDSRGCVSLAWQDRQLVTVSSWIC